MNEENNISFTTATIFKWRPLLKEDSLKDIIISSLQTLTHLKHLTVYAFVIMPNQFHVIWSENEHNKKESSQASFFKYTGHAFQKKLAIENRSQLEFFKVNKSDRNYQFWQKNHLDIVIFSKKIFDQKLEYIHNNPVQERWKLVIDPLEYKYSSASFYEMGIDEFGILTDYYFD